MRLTMNYLLQEIENSFNAMPMPARADLFVLEDEESQSLAEDLEQIRGKPLSSDVLRLLHQELRKLSPKATLWITPHYLRYSIKDEARYTQSEVEFFVYSLASTRAQNWLDVATRLSSFNSRQLKCLGSVLSHLMGDEFWSQYLPEQLESAEENVKRTLASR